MSFSSSGSEDKGPTSPGTRWASRADRAPGAALWRLGLEAQGERSRRSKNTPEAALSAFWLPRSSASA